jgi:hypothetical protein
VFGSGDIEPAESFFFFAKCDINCRDRLGRDVSGSPFLQELIENFPRLDLLAYPRVSNGKAKTKRKLVYEKFKHHQKPHPSGSATLVSGFHHRPCASLFG